MRTTQRALSDVTSVQLPELHSFHDALHTPCQQVQFPTCSQPSVVISLGCAIMVLESIISLVLLAAGLGLKASCLQTSITYRLVMYSRVQLARVHHIRESPLRQVVAEKSKCD